MDSTQTANLYANDYLIALQRFVEVIGYNRTAWVEWLLETFKELSLTQATELVEEYVNNYVEQLRQLYSFGHRISHTPALHW